MLWHILLAMRDTRAAQRLVRDMENGGQCCFEIVSSGSSALSSCARRMPDMLVIDAVLPQMDGLGVLDELRSWCGRMPCVIGGAAMPFAEAGFVRRGVNAVVRVPWEQTQLRAALLGVMQACGAQISWDEHMDTHAQACALLEEMGMHARLKGFDYLAWAASLAYADEECLFAVGERLYAPIAQRFLTTPACVERLIRHAVESTMSAARARGVYHLFGNTIDPAKGKPTNAQIIALLVQRLRVKKNGIQAEALRFR